MSLRFSARSGERLRIECASSGATDTDVGQNLCGGGSLLLFNIVIGIADAMRLGRRGALAWGREIIGYRPPGVAGKKQPASRVPRATGACASPAKSNAQGRTAEARAGYIETFGAG